VPGGRAYTAPSLRTPPVRRCMSGELLAGVNAANAQKFFALLSKARDIDKRVSAIAGFAARQLAERDHEFSGEATRVYLRQGMTTLDGSALLGRNGHVFLIGGTNHVRRLYTPGETDEHRNQSQLWIDLFSARRHKMRESGIKYLQLVIPEKISLLPELFPEALTAPSPFLRLIEKGFKSPAYLSTYDLFRNSPQRTDLFVRVDTHLSEKGAFLLFKTLVEKLGFTGPEEPLFHEAGDFFAGDLSDRFFGEPLLNKRTRVSGSQVDALSASVQLIDNLDPADGRQTGTVRVWRNPRAPIQETLVAFGNSFFERGNEPRQLSWWFSRYFREFHFVWEPRLVAEYVEKVRPNTVICQTIERFLALLPHD
jgi:hypothetical protein